MLCRVCDERLRGSSEEALYEQVRVGVRVRY